MAFITAALGVAVLTHYSIDLPAHTWVIWLYALAYDMFRG